MCSRGDDEDDDDEIEENKKILNPQIDNAETEIMDTQPSPLLLQGNYLVNLSRLNYLLCWDR